VVSELQEPTKMICYVGNDSRPLRAAARHSLAQLRRSITVWLLRSHNSASAVEFMVRYVSATSQRDPRSILVPYEVCHLVEIQVWLGEDVVQQRSEDLWRNA
jgi:hypothetical protein